MMKLSESIAKARRGRAMLERLRKSAFMLDATDANHPPTEYWSHREETLDVQGEVEAVADRIGGQVMKLGDKIAKLEHKIAQNGMGVKLEDQLAEIRAMVAAIERRNHGGSYSLPVQNTIHEAGLVDNVLKELEQLKRKVDVMAENGFETHQYREPPPPRYVYRERPVVFEKSDAQPEDCHVHLKQEIMGKIALLEQKEALAKETLNATREEVRETQVKLVQMTEKNRDLEEQVSTMKSRLSEEQRKSDVALRNLETQLAKSQNELEMLREKEAFAQGRLEDKQREMLGLQHELSNLFQERPSSPVLEELAASQGNRKAVFHEQATSPIKRSKEEMATSPMRRNQGEMATSPINRHMEETATSPMSKQHNKEEIATSPMRRHSKEEMATSTMKTSRTMATSPMKAMRTQEISVQRDEDFVPALEMPELATIESFRLPKENEQVTLKELLDRLQGTRTRVLEAEREKREKEVELRGLCTQLEQALQRKEAFVQGSENREDKLQTIQSLQKLTVELEKSVDERKSKLHELRLVLAKHRTNEPDDYFGPKLEQKRKACITCHKLNKDLWSKVADLEQALGKNRAGFKKKVEELEEQLKELRFRTDKEIRKLSDMENSMEDGETEIATQNKNMRVLEHEVRAVELRAEELREKRVILQQQRIRWDSMTQEVLTDLEFTQNKHEKLQKQFEDTVHKQEVLTKQLQELRHDVEERKRLLSDARKESEDLESKVQSVEASIAESMVAQTKAETELKHVHEHKTKMVRELELKNQTLAGMIERESKRLRDLQTSKASLNQEIGRITLEVDELSKQVQNQESVFVHLQEQAEAGEMMQHKMLQLSNMANFEQNQLNKALRKEEKLSSFLAEMNVELGKAKGRVTKLVQACS